MNHYYPKQSQTTWAQAHLYADVTFFGSFLVQTAAGQPFTDVAQITVLCLFSV